MTKVLGAIALLILAFLLRFLDEGSDPHDEYMED